MLGIENTGIYRLSGTTSRVQALKHALDSSTFLYLEEPSS